MQQRRGGGASEWRVFFRAWLDLWQVRRAVVLVGGSDDGVGCGWGGFVGWVCC